MASKTASKSTKIVQVVARYFIKRNGHVVYTVRSSNGKDTYTTTLVNGKATGCSCPATKPCYHMVQLQEREAARSASTPEQVAAIAESQAEAKMQAFKSGLDAQYASDPRVEAETAASYVRMFYSGY